MNNSKPVQRRQKIRLFDFFELENPNKPAGYAFMWSDEPDSIQLHFAPSVLSRAKGKDLILTRFPGDARQCLVIPIREGQQKNTPFEAEWRDFMAHY